MGICLVLLREVVLGDLSLVLIGLVEHHGVDVAGISLGCPQVLGVGQDANHDERDEEANVLAIRDKLVAVEVHERYDERKLNQEVEDLRQCFVIVYFKFEAVLTLLLCCLLIIVRLDHGQTIVQVVSWRRLVAHSKC